MRRVRQPGLRVIALVVVALALAGVGLSVLPAGDPGDHDRAVLGSAPRALPADECRDVLLVGLDGGGERPAAGVAFGRTVEVFHRAYARLAALRDRSLEVRRIGFYGSPPSALLAAHPRVDDARKAVNATRARAWRDGVAAAASNTVSALDSAAVTCPEQQVVLVGYAQGAAVVHRVVSRLAARPDGLARVVGAALVSDPDRRYASHTTQLIGDPAAPRRSIGVFPAFLRPIADVPATAPTFEVWNVCTRGDLVCDSRHNGIKDALRTARSYGADAGARTVRSAAAGLWSVTTRWPLPRPRVQVVQVHSGEAMNLQLGVTVAPAYAAGVVWADPMDLPPGVSLSEAGLLSGTPTGTGTWNTTYVVRNTDPATTPATGVVVITVQPSAASVSAGGQTSCETRSDGTAWCWGRNNFGQLGDGTTTTRSSPVRVGTATDWVSVTTSGSSACATREDGSLWCWGLNNFGQLGIGRTAPKVRPVRVGDVRSWTSVSNGWFHTCATRSNGTLWCWGLNNRGQVGDGTTTLRGHPTQVGTARTWASVTAGGFHTCATRTDGTAWCWGQNVFGQLGNTDVDPRTSPVRVGTLDTWVQLNASWAHTCGVTSDGAGRCWGLNNRGQLGDGSRALRRTPVLVSGDRIWTSISTGDATTCGLDNVGGAYCWGSGRYGQVGDGQRQDRLVPALVASSHPWLLVDAGWFHACGGLDSGVTTCWGNNEMGQLGDGGHADRSAPEEAR